MTKSEAVLQIIREARSEVARVGRARRTLKALDALGLEGADRSYVVEYLELQYVLPELRTPANYGTAPRTRGPR